MLKAYKYMNKINLKKYTEKKLVKFLCDNICKNYEFPTSYNVVNYQELSRAELQKEKEILFIKKL